MGRRERWLREKNFLMIIISTSLYFSDRQGLPLTMSEPIAGYHNDLYHIEIYFDQVTQTLEKVDIAVQGLFMNADAGFDAQNFRKHCENKDIMANIAFNKRNGADTDEIYFDELLPSKICYRKNKCLVRQL